MTTATELETTYGRRFDASVAYRERVWRVLVDDYFSQYIPADGSVLDLGCGYGQFINNAKAAHRYAMDLNPRTRDLLDPQITFFEQDCSAPWTVPANSLDLVFTSNFFEHLPTKEALSRTLGNAYTALKPGGKIVAMGPNIRFTGGAYWDFYDHHLALTERSLTEAMEIVGFKGDTVIPRFLPYTMVGQRERPTLLIRAYLLMPLVWRLFGHQFLVVASKTS